jgi:hypothetical protein
MDNPEGETALKHRHGARPLRYWEAIRMSEPFPNFRNRLFDSGLILMTIECGIYLCGVAAVNLIEPVNTKLRMAAWLFVIGSSLSVIVLTLSAFGLGWKRLTLALASLLSIFFWYGLTLY